MGDESEIIDILEPFLMENGFMMDNFVVSYPRKSFYVTCRWQSHVPSVRCGIDGTKITVFKWEDNTMKVGLALDLHHPDSLTDLIRYLKDL